MESTKGILTTTKLQAALDLGVKDDVTNREELAAALTSQGASIGVHGINTWFRHADSYGNQRSSLSGSSMSYAIPKRRWTAILDALALGSEALELDDDAFQKHCVKLGRLYNIQTPYSERVRQDTVSYVIRRGELSQLRDKWGRACEGQPTVVLVEGIAGSGKSTLARALAEDVTSTDSLVIVCSGFEDRDVPMQPIIDGIHASGKALRQCNQQLAIQVDHIIQSYFATGASLHSSSQLVSLLLEFANLRPLLIIVDDAHWIDESSRTFIEQLHFRIASATYQLLIVALYRPQYRGSSWPVIVNKLSDRNQSSVIKLSELNIDELGALLVGEDELKLSQACLYQIRETSLGNPLHAKRLFRFLIEHKHVENRNGFIDLTKNLQDLDMPKGIVSFFFRDMTNLSSSQMEILTFAACLGARFTFRELGKVVKDHGESGLLDALDAGEAAGLINVSGMHYEFSHPLARFAFFQSHTKTRISHICYQIAINLKDYAEGMRLIDVANLMLQGAVHAEPAELAEITLKAIAIANDVGAWRQVLKLSASIEGYSIDLSSPDVARLHRYRANGFHKSGQYERAIEELEKAIAHFTTIGDRLGQLACLSDKVQIQGNFSLVDASKLDHIIQLKQHIESVQDMEAPGVCARALGTLALQYYYAKQSRTARNIIDRALSILESEPDESTSSYLYIINGLVVLAQLDLVRATDSFERALSAAARVEDHMSAAQALQRLTIPYLMLGRFSEVTETNERAEGYGQIANNTGEIALSMAMSATALVACGKGQEAIDIAQRGIEQATITNYAPSIVPILYASAFAYYSMGRTEDVRGLLQQASKTNRFSKNPKTYIDTIRRISLLLEYLEGLKISPQDHALITTQKLDSDYCHFTQLTEYAIDLLLAREVGNHRQMSMCREALETARQHGIAYTVGWCFNIDELLSNTPNNLGYRSACL